MINISKLKYVLFLIIFLISNIAKSDIIKSIEVIGNDRISNEIVILFSELKIENEYSSNDLNDAIKKLYETKYFKNISIKTIDTKIIIEVKENPIIQSVSITGIKSSSILNKLSEVTKKSEKYPYLKDEIKIQKDLLINILRATGFYFAEVETQIESNDNNTVNINYIFDTGDRAKIKKIKFIGNKVFKDSKLRNLIISEEAKPWKFITTNVYLDPNRIKTDKNFLINYFKNNGYYNVKINTSSAKVIDDNYFELIFNIDSGIKYFFNDLNLKVSEEFSQENFDQFLKIFDELKGKKYSLNSIKKIMEEIDKTALEKEFVFINAKYDELIVDNNKINIDIIFEEGDKFFVEQINIFGNFITEEKVIRNSLIIDEGDAYNKILFNKSINEIKSKNIFKSVTADILDIDKNNNKKVININVEEKPTGEIFAGAGTGTGGSSIAAGIKENNYLGKGIKLDSNLFLGDDEIKGKFSVTNPNFRNSDRSLFTTIQSTSSDFMTTSGYKTSRTGLEFGTSFEQYNNLFVNFKLSNYYEKLETSDSASAIKKKQEGDYFENLFSYGLTLNNLDQNFQPTDGYITSFNQTLPIYSDDLTVENLFKSSRYYSFGDEFILSGKFYAKAVNSIDDNVRVSKRVYIPSKRLRGFESGSVGPKDGTQFIGGNYGAAFNLNTSVPNILNNNENIDFNVFFDAANLWHVDYDSSLDSDKIRSSTGLAFDWFTPIGPLSFSYAIPLTEAKTDKTESFRFQIGTSF